MRTFAFTIVFALLGAAAHAQDAASAERGQKVFTAQKCTICHAIAGQGNRNGALDEVGSKLSGDEIREWITNAPAMAAKVKAERKPAMRAFTNIAAKDLDDLVAYLQSLKKK
jgi:mono/diheme cytochrome c family protein